MKTIFSAVFYIAFSLCLIGIPLPAQDAAPSESEQRAADLEAKLRQTLESSDEGARILLELINLYYDEGQIFGLVRSGKIFATAQAGHPQHEEVMGKLIDGLAVASQNADLKATVLQFLERYPNSKKTADAHRLIARVYHRENKRREAADHYRLSWEKRGPSGWDDAEKAFLLYRDLRSNVTAELMCQMALKLMDQLPAGVGATEFGYQAMHQARSYGSQTQLSNTVARKILAKKLPLSARQKWEIPHLMGENSRHEKQYTNAIKSYQQSIAAGSTSNETNRSLIRSLYDSQAPPAQIEKAINDYRRSYPNESKVRVGEMLYLLASAKHRAEDVNGAISSIHETLKLNSYYANYLFTWTGDEKLWKRSEQVYRDVARGEPQDEWRLHYYAAITHFRDRLKNEAQSKSILTSEVLYKNPLPNAGSTFGSALNYILASAPNEAGFQNEVRRFVANAKKNGHNQSYTKAIESWLNGNKKSKDPEIQKRYKWAQAEYDKLRKDPTFRLWGNALQSRMKGHSAREQLLKTNLSREQKLQILNLHAYDIRHYGDSRRRNAALPFYREAAQLDPSDYRIARYWIETAASYGNADQCRTAIDHLVKLDQEQEDPVGWYYASQAARKTEDKNVMKKAITWIQRQQKIYQQKNHYGGNIVGNLVALEMEAEAESYMKQVASRDPNHGDTMSSVIGLATKLEEGAPRINFLQQYLNPPSDGYGDYASRIAEEYLKQNDFANFEKTCRDAIKVRSERRLRRWSFYVHDWVSRARSHKEWTAAQKATVFRVVSDLRQGRDSAQGKLALLEVEGHQMKPIERLLAYRDTTLESTNDSTSFRYLIGWGQAAIGRGEFAEAAAMGTGILANVTNVGEDYKEQARVLIREAYGKMGALGMEVSADNPMAPLLEIGLHLKLGDRTRALEAYSQNRDRFDEFMLELPADLVIFAADSHITAGGEENQDRAESILRKWMVAHSESEKFTDSEKARVQLLLAKNYNRAKRYEVARSEYTTVVNRYPDTEEATEARFGIGETQMSQKIFDQAEETFTELSNNPAAKVRVRGMFLLGVLEGRKGNPDEARQIFKDVLSSMPDVALANETLFNLSEVYRGEQRYLEQLELLRTVGRLGQESKRWHEPGRALSIVVQDSDLGISRGHTRIPVLVTTEPGGDRELIHISSGGAGKGLFIGEVETTLGEPKPENGLLEVSGQDLVKVDYPEDFKSEFQFDPLSTGDIGLAVDAEFTMASSQIVDESEETESERLAREATEEGDLRMSIQRPANQIKPGNPVYLRVQDFDRDLSNATDQVLVKLTASSGDEVQAILKETGSHSGIFEGTVETSDLPAGALATDTAIEHSPLMAIDKDSSTAWVSQPDGVTPKFLSVDLKELRTVTKGTFSTPNPEDQAPVRGRLQGSHDGRYWYPLAEHPQRPTLEKPAGDSRNMTRRVWHMKGGRYDEWKQVMRLTGIEPHEKEEVTELSYATELPIDAEERRKKGADPCAVIFQGSFIQPRSGAVRLGLRGDRVAVIINGFPVQPLVTVQRQLDVDVYLEAGIHDLFVFASTRDSARRKIDITRSRENPNNSTVRLTRFVREDFDLTQSFVAGLKPIKEYPLGSMSVDDDGLWQFSIDPRELRHVRFVVDEYLGQAVAINNVTVSGPENQFIPTEADLLQLSSNNRLEITPGDRIDSVYIDELPTGGQPKNRAIAQQLNATYFDGTLESIAYDFNRLTNGQVEEIEKDLLRIDPGERITLKVIDYDMDTTGQQDQLPIKVQIGDGKPRELIATETESTSGIFKIEIDTIDPQATPPEGEAAKPETAEKLSVKRGDQIYFTYRDQENTFPGHAIDRSSVVFVREPTKGTMRILETRYAPPEEEGRNPTITYLDASDKEVKGVAYEVPLTIEVIDEDAARNSLSEVIVEILLDGAPDLAEPVEVACKISSAFSDLENTLTNVKNPALHQGRFIGQVTMRLGDDGSPRIVPGEPGRQNNLIGRVVPPWVEDLATGQMSRPEINPGMLGVLNLTGADTIKVSYADSENPSAQSITHLDQAKMLGSAALTATDNSYEDAVEKLQVGERLFLRLSDPDRDVSAERDKVTVSVTSPNGEKETVPLEETLSHSGIFTGSFKLRAKPEPIPGNFDPVTSELEVFFGQGLDVAYVDPVPASEEGSQTHGVSIPVSDGTDGEVAAFTKIFGNEDLAIQTQFHIAESYFELFKSHLNLGRKEEADNDLRNGRRILRELQEDYPDPKYAPRVAYLLGQFAQELKSWDEAIEAYETIVKQYPDHTLAADSQYKLGQCYEEAKRLDEALEAYVTLAATYPQNPLISNVMIRINDHFYKKEDYEVAAQVGAQFLERFETHEWAPRMAFRVGQCYYKDEKYKTAGEAFDEFVKRFPDDDLTAQSLFWSGESYRQGRNNRVAFQRYNRCRWDFPNPMPPSIPAVDSPCPK